MVTTVEATDLIRERHPAVDILDWEMPMSSGLEQTAVIKGDTRGRDTPGFDAPIIDDKARCALPRVQPRSS